MTVENFLLSDDEVVALAVAREAAWPSGLPTVDATVREDLSAAAFRGNRSLLVRGLLRIDDPNSPAEAIADEVCRSSGRIVVFIADLEFTQVNWGLASTHHAVDGDWLLETVSPVGVHRFTYEPVEDHVAYLRAILEGATEAGPVAETTPERLCMLGIGTAGAELVAAAGGSLRIGGFDPDSTSADMAGFETADPAVAVDRLVAVATT